MEITQKLLKSALAYGLILLTMPISATTYEDAENNVTTGWVSYGDTADVTVENVEDIERGSRVIKLTGNGKNTGYRLGNRAGRVSYVGAWNNQTEKVLQWSMKYDEPFRVYIPITTEQGNRYLTYTNQNVDNKGKIRGGKVNYGLGEDSVNGEWHTYTRDLEADWNAFMPDDPFVSVNGLFIKGSGYIDDIMSSSSLTFPVNTTKPVITLLGDANITLTVGDSYTDAGAIATDDVDGNITASIVTVNSIDTSIVGDYTVIYDVNDSSGNTADTKIRMVHVVSALDVIKPILTLLGDDNISVIKGTNYIDAGAIASDNIDGDISAEIVIDNPVDTDAEIGTKFVVIYSVFDNAGNSATATRNITIVRDLNISLTDWIANGAGTWILQSDNKSVKQTINGNPTIYHNNVDSQSDLFKISGQITVQTSADDDYIGFVLGYHDGDVDKDGVDYLLIDWKQGNQSDPIGNATRGLAISRVTKKLGNTAGAWIHSSEDGVTELQRATTLGDTGWTDNTTYTFEITFTETLVEVFIDGVKELSVSGIFNNGAYGFYNYSQASVLYSAIEVNTNN